MRYLNFNIKKKKSQLIRRVWAIVKEKKKTSLSSKYELNQFHISHKEIQEQLKVYLLNVMIKNLCPITAFQKRYVHSVTSFSLKSQRHIQHISIFSVSALKHEDWVRKASTFHNKYGHRLQFIISKLKYIKFGPSRAGRKTGFPETRTSFLAQPGI